MPVTLSEQIRGFEEKRAATVAQMSAIMDRAGTEGRTLDASEAEEYDTLDGEVKAIDEHLARLKAQEARVASSAAPAPRKIAAEPKGGTVEVPSGVILTKPNVQKGVAFTRYVKSLWKGNWNPYLALQYAAERKDWRDSTPQVIEALRQKASVAANSAGSSGGGSNLVYNQNLAGEFIDLVRPATIIGRLALRRVPFNIRIGSKSSGTTGYWVGEGKPIPVSRLGTSEVTLGMAKAAGLCVLTRELMDSSEPAAEGLVRDDLIAANVDFLDEQFIAPDYAAVANVNPASITNGVVPTAASGTALTNVRTDVQTMLKAFVNNNIPLDGLAFVMHTNVAIALSLMQNAVGAREFPDMTPQGGTLFGFPAVASQNAAQVGSPVAGEGQLFVLLNAREILLADDGEADVEASGEASIQMLDNPTNDTTTPTATTMVSMFQTDSVALRAVRKINWAPRRSNVVQYVKDAAYTAS